MSVDAGNLRLTESTFEAVCTAVKEVIGDAMVTQNGQPLSEAAVNMIDSQTRSWLMEFFTHQPNGYTSANVLVVAGYIGADFSLLLSPEKVEELALRLRNLLGR